MRQIVLDTETTGLEPAAGHHIIEIGCVTTADLEGEPVNWISVEDRLPEKGVEVLVCYQYAGIPHFAIDEYDDLFESPVSFSSASICVGEGWREHDFESVTHWLPIPEFCVGQTRMVNN